MTGREDDLSGPGRRQEGDQGTSNQDSGSDRTHGGGKKGGLPPVSRAGSRDFPGLTADFRVDILEHGDKVIVVAELPGADKNEIQINLPTPQTLRITARRPGPVEEKPGTYYIHERGDGTLSRMIRLPASVVEDGAETGFKNGVLELCLKKMGKPGGPGGKKIPIE